MGKQGRENAIGLAANPIAAPDHGATCLCCRYDGLITHWNGFLPPGEGFRRTSSLHLILQAPLFQGLDDALKGVDNGARPLGKEHSYGCDSAHLIFG